jgi:uncharacterized protein YozE (UPF0346 family)
MKRYIATLSFLVFVGALFFVSPSSAQTELTASQRQAIQQDCESIKADLTQLHARDALLRVNMGQHYELISTRLISRFNARLVANGLEAGRFITVSDDYTVNLSLFRASYQEYERDLTALLRINCRENPESFYESLLTVRDSRLVVHSNVVELNKNLSTYGEFVDALDKEIRGE